jgi:hypothetical protein
MHGERIKIHMSGFAKNLACTSGDSTEAFKLFVRNCFTYSDSTADRKAYLFFFDRLYITITGLSLKYGDFLDTYLLLSFISKLLKLCGI